MKTLTNAGVQDLTIDKVSAFMESNNTVFLNYNEGTSFIIRVENQSEAESVAVLIGLNPENWTVEDIMGLFGEVKKIMDTGFFPIFETEFGVFTLEFFESLGDYTNLHSDWKILSQSEYKEIFTVQITNYPRAMNN